MATAPLVLGARTQFDSRGALDAAWKRARGGEYAVCVRAVGGRVWILSCYHGPS